MGISMALRYISATTIILLALTCFTFPKDAAAQRKGYVNGAGTIGCGDYLKVRAQEDQLQKLIVSEWALGFISAYNIFSSHSGIDLPSKNTVIVYLDKYCRDNPLHKVVSGVSQLIGDSGGWSPTRKN